MQVVAFLNRGVLSFIFQPSSSFAWDLILLAALVYLLLFIPFHLSFSTAPTRWTLLPVHLSWSMLRAQFAADALIWIDLASAFYNTRRGSTHPNLRASEAHPKLRDPKPGLRARVEPRTPQTFRESVSRSVAVICHSSLGLSLVGVLPYDVLLFLALGASDAELLLVAALLRAPKLLNVRRIGVHARRVAAYLPPSLQLAGGAARLFQASLSISLSLSLSLCVCACACACACACVCVCMCSY